ncbi:hypothetical protein BGZ67_000609 [Mortierella alpina]|nr:hypothetical protein BGZ67_000609 [Mortierella alpina]
MVSPINWLRILIICLALTSLSIGFYLRGQREFPDVLIIMLATDIVVVFLYAEFVYKSSVEVQFRGWRMFLRFILAFMTVYGPAMALDQCSYYSTRDYSEQSPGFQMLGHISCIRDSYDSKGIEEVMLPLFRLFRVRCIITATVYMIRPINQLRILILCLSLCSFIIGLYVKGRLEFPDKLALITAAEVLNFIFYSFVMITSYSGIQMRGWRIFNRMILVFLAIYAPASALRGCEYRLRRDYYENRPGINYYDRIQCDDGSRDARSDETLLPAYQLFRARCIIMLTVSVLMFIEMVFYWRSYEGSEPSPSPPQDAALADIELGNTSLGEPQKMVLPMPTPAPMPTSTPVHTTAT